MSHTDECDALLPSSSVILANSLHIHDSAFYPYANTSGAGASYGSVNNPDAPNIVNVAVPPHTDPATFRQLFSGIVEKVAAFQPSILFISGAALPFQAASRKL